MKRPTSAMNATPITMIAPPSGVKSTRKNLGPFRDAPGEIQWGARLERGWGGGLFVFAPEHSVFAVHPFGEGLRLYLVSLFFISVSLMTVTSLAFFFSCQRMKPAAAAILTVAIFFIDFKSLKLMQSTIE